MKRNLEQSKKNTLLEINNYQYFTLLIILAFTSSIINRYFLNTDALVINYYSEQLSEEVINSILESRSDWEWFGYLLIPILIIFRANLVAICLSVGLFFYDIERIVKYKKLLKIALIGEFVFVLIGFFKLFYFAFIKPKYTFEDLNYFFPFSYSNFLNIETIEPWLIYPLQTINLFEVSYFFVLVYGVYKLLQNKYWKSFEMVAVSYGTGLVIWVGFVMFLTLNIT